jgi:hypothetical protein
LSVSSATNLIASLEKHKGERVSDFTLLFLSRQLQCSTAMRLPAFGAVLLLCLAAGCARDRASVTPSDADHAYPYNKPLTSLGAKFAIMPMVAQNTVRAEAGMAEIFDVVKDSTAERVFFKVYFKDPVNFPPLYVAPDGSVLRPDLTIAVAAPPPASDMFVGGPITAATLADLPPNAAKVVVDHASNAEIAAINKEIWGNHVVYVISFKDEARHPRLYVVADGEILHPAPKQ